MKFFSHYYPAQIREAIALVMKEEWNQRHDDLVMTMIKQIEDERGTHYFILLEGLRAPVTVFITETSLEDCDEDAKYFLNDIKEECLCIHRENFKDAVIDMNEHYDGLFIILDQTVPFFVTSNTITPTGAPQPA